jgi:hypothetical protein
VRPLLFSISEAPVHRFAVFPRPHREFISPSPSAPSFPSDGAREGTYRMPAVYSACLHVSVKNQACFVGEAATKASGMRESCDSRVFEVSFLSQG